MSLEKKDAMEPEAPGPLSRRIFLQNAAFAGAGLALGGMALGAEPAKSSAPASSPVSAPAKEAEVAIGLIGFGWQGRGSLTPCLLKIPGVRFVAVCDIWPYKQDWAAKALKAEGHSVNVYTDYQDMLEKEKSLDAVVIATPDFVHSEQTVACLRAGKHVYCEKEMSQSLEGAKQMVLAARETGKLLQIGHQRRSNPFYHTALSLIYNDKFLGRITHFSGQWNKPVQEEAVSPKGKEIDEATLKKYGYPSMREFLNWRWFKKYSGGPISDLGSHQIDIFNWMLKAQPKAVTANGGQDYFKGREWYDNIMTVYEYALPEGTVRGTYQVLYTTSYGGYYEVFNGDAGALVISEDPKKCFLFREPGAKKLAWEENSEQVEKGGDQGYGIKIGESPESKGEKMGAGDLKALLEKPVWQFHLENFFDAIRHGKPLNCPGDAGYETAVSVLRVNEALASGQRMEFKPEEFKV